MIVPGPHHRFVRSKTAFALPLSIALHVILIFALSRTQWLAAETESLPETKIVWLQNWPTEPPEERALEPELPPESSLPPPQETLRTADVPSPEVNVPRAADVGPREPPPNSSQPPPEPASTDTLPTDVDWYEEGRQAVAKLVEQRALEHDYATFSSDLFDEAPEAAAGPREELFDGPRRRPAAMRPGRSRTAFGRWVSETCNALTGGISVFGLASLCAEQGESADFFADIKPDYLKSLPVCTEVDFTLPSIDGDGPVEEGSAIKCELVVQED